MKNTYRFLTLFLLLALLAFGLPSSARAFDGRSGDQVVIAAGEVIEDDLYVSAEEFVLDGTVNGDVVAVGRTITINGTINGDLIAAGQTIAIHGKVTDDARIAGSVLLIGENASVGGDLISAGYSLETRAGSTIGQDVVFAGGQALFSGEIARNLRAATGGLELRGAVGGNVSAEVGEVTQGPGGPPPGMPVGSPIPVPAVKPGLTIASSARIAGDLQYTSSGELSFPAGVIAGTVTRLDPVVNRALPREKTPGEKALAWGLDLLRAIVTLVLLGLLLLWLAPKSLNALSERLRAAPAASLGWGLIACASFVVALMVILFVMIVTAAVFGMLTLGGLSGTAVVVGSMAMLTLIVAFVLATAFLAKIVVGLYGGRWILGQFNPELASHRIWPLVVGTAVVAILIALPYVGWLANLLVVLLGLGALWLLGREKLAGRAAAA